MSKIVLLDRDGVINQDSLDYIKSVEEFVFLPGSIEAIVRLTQAGYRIGVATNQSGIARGYYSEEDVQAIHQAMISQIRKAGGEIAAIEYCKHLPSECCICRKPQPGMLQRLAAKLNCDLKGLPFIGDRVSDIQAAEAADAQPLLVFSSMTDRVNLKAYPHVPAFNSLSLCVDYLLG